MNIVGIASCPVGVAHTPMAAKALTKAGEQLGHTMKMEQQGGMGRINEITAQDIASADFLLIASDQKIEGMDRFEGKIPILRVNINTCIKAPEAVINKCVKAVIAKKNEQ